MQKGLIISTFLKNLNQTIFKLFLIDLIPMKYMPLFKLFKISFKYIQFIK
jgi:hypothetical protein